MTPVKSVSTPFGSHNVSFRFFRFAVGWTLFLILYSIGAFAQDFGPVQVKVGQPLKIVFTWAPSPDPYIGDGQPLSLEMIINEPGGSIVDYLSPQGSGTFSTTPGRGGQSTSPEEYDNDTTPAGRYYIVLGGQGVIPPNLPTIVGNLEIFSGGIPVASFVGMPFSSSNTGWFHTISVDAGLPAPTDLTVTPNDHGSLDLSWHYLLTDVTGFKIERKSANSDFVEIARVTGGDQREYVDPQVPGGVMFTYRVHAYSGSTDSPYSNEASGMGRPLTLTDIGLGFPHFDQSNNLVVRLFVKGSGSGSISGQWLRDTTVLAQPTMHVGPLVPQTWQKVTDLTARFEDVVGSGYALKFGLAPTIGTPPLITEPVYAAVTGFRPDANGWWFQNYSPLGGRLFGLDGECLGMSVKAANLFINGGDGSMGVLRAAFDAGTLTMRQIEKRFVETTQAQSIHHYLRTDFPRWSAYGATGIDATLTEADNTFADVQRTGNPIVMCLLPSGGAGDGHAVVVAAAFASTHLVHALTIGPSNALADYSFVRLFAVYDSNFPGEFEDIFVCSSPSQLGVGYWGDGLGHGYDYNLDSLVEFTSNLGGH